MVSSIAVLSSLKHVATTKLNQLVDQAEKFETNEAAILDDVAANIEHHAHKDCSSKQPCR